MESNSNHQFKVGVFLSAGILVLLVSIFMLGADKAILKKYTNYRVHFDSVQGLNDGSVVSMAGVVIGNVQEIKFDDNSNSIEVHIRIEEKYSSRITEGTSAEIRTQGALGDKFVYIIPGEPSAKVLPSASILPVAKASDLLGIISERGKETDKIFDIINEVYKTTRTFNHEGRLDKIMGNLAATTQNLKEASAEAKQFATQMNLSKSPERITASIEKMDRILTKIDKGDGTLGALINDPSLHNQLKSLIGNSQRKSHIKNLLRDSIDSPAEK